MIRRFKHLFERKIKGIRSGPPRVLAYCASNVGMGHYCRLLRVLGEARRLRPELDILLATDAPDLSLARRLGLAVLQLPRFQFIDDQTFKERPEALSITSHQLRDLRADILRAAGLAFDPDLLLADTNPHGKRDELLPLLKRLRAAGRTRVYLIMRDIPCPPGESFKLNGPPAGVRKHASYYDAFLLAGDPRFFDPAAAYGWPEDVRQRMHPVGFVVPRVEPADRAEVLRDYPGLDPARPLVVASFGGGWEVQSTLERLMEGLAVYRQQSGVLAQLAAITGPALDESQLLPLLETAGRLGGVVIERFIEDFPRLLAKADLAVLQAGSTPFQLLDGDIPILLTVREYKSREQDERAQRLAALPGVRLVQQDSPDWNTPAEWIFWGLEHPRRPRQATLNLNGVVNAAQAVLEALER